jgi:hypothetical protein
VDNAYAFVLEVFSARRSKNQFLFMFTGCVHLLYISVHRCHCRLGLLLIVLCFRFCFQVFNCIKKGYFVLELFIGVGNRDIMTKELSLI